MPARLDESKWIPIHSKLHRKNDPWEVIPVNIDFPCDKAIILVSQLEAKINWHKAGWLVQRWQRMMTPVKVKKLWMPLNEFFTFDVEPVERSILWFHTVEWLPEVVISVEVRRYVPQLVEVDLSGIEGTLELIANRDVPTTYDVQ